MIDCVSSIRQWSGSPRLKLNASKSEVIWLGSRQQLSNLSADDRTLILPDGALKPTTVVNNLGVLCRRADDDGF